MLGNSVTPDSEAFQREKSRGSDETARGLKRVCCSRQLELFLTFLTHPVRQLAGTVGGFLSCPYNPGGI